MAVVENWLPPSRENWEWLCYVWQFFPLVSLSCAYNKHLIKDLAKSFYYRSQLYSGSSTGILKARRQQSHVGMYQAGLGGRLWSLQAQ
jgi:hypothetical protein